MCHSHTDICFRWVEVCPVSSNVSSLVYSFTQLFMASAHSLRLAVPLGLNVCPPFHSITKAVKPVSILPPARTVIEDETRRNSMWLRLLEPPIEQIFEAFWLAYATERQHGCSNGWAFSLDDQDISQLLPVRGDQFEQGVCSTSSRV